MKSQCYSIHRRATYQLYLPHPPPQDHNATDEERSLSHYLFHIYTLHIYIHAYYLYMHK